MYCKFFKFSQKPFDITPRPEFLYATPGHSEALASLIYGIRERRGFVVMVGVGDQNAPWRCLVANDGTVQEVTSQTDEGNL